VDRNIRFPPLPRDHKGVNLSDTEIVRRDYHSPSPQLARKTLGGVLGNPEAVLTPEDGFTWAGQPMEAQQKAFNRRRNPETEWQKAFRANRP
jgi:hypothetical protein